LWREVAPGQRELILGDRQTGKTTIAIDAILNQRGQDVVCVYCAIGQRASAVAKAVANLREQGAMDYTVVVVTEGNDPPGLAYIAPYAATSIAEYFMEAGRDVLIVYDDLTQHARAYSELSLLLRRPPGREAFPGDIFYIHSRLLERATHLRPELGGGSLTALPIIETGAQNIADYIPTNLISITDGQIYLSPSLFELGVLPAVDVGKSVSRVGGKAQRAAYRAVAGDLKLAYAQFEELETFARFGARLDDNTRKIVEHGRRIRACLKQAEFAPVSVLAQIAILLSLTAGLFDGVPLAQMNDVVADHALKALAGLDGQAAGLGGRRARPCAPGGRGLFAVPNSVQAITPLVGQILVESETSQRPSAMLRAGPGEAAELHLFYNRPASGAVYAPVSQRLLPLDQTWHRSLAERSWPTGNLPEVMGGGTATLRALIREYLFVSLFRACAESLASENASRLAAMQRADKNIDELLEGLNGTFHRLRQSGIDEELFDVISGYEALSTGKARRSEA